MKGHSTCGMGIHCIANVFNLVVTQVKKKGDNGYILSEHFNVMSTTSKKY